MLYKDHATVPHRQRALAYEQAMEQLAATYPDDVEAKILSALIISANHDLNDKTFARPLKAAALLEPLFAAYPQHPGVAHYLIHSYDYPPIAPQGAGGGETLRRIAPDAAHAHHMPSHIFTRVGFWRESVASNQASVAAAKGDALYTLHGWDYMAYAYLQMAEDAKAEQVGAEARALRALNNTSFGALFGAAAIPARLALERGRWAEAATLALPAHVSAEDWKRSPQAEAINVFARALGAARSGDAAGRAAGDRASARPAPGAHGTQAGLLGRAGRDPGARSPVPGRCARKARMTRRSPRCAPPPTMRIRPRSTR